MSQLQYNLLNNIQPEFPDLLWLIYSPSLLKCTESEQQSKIIDGSFNVSQSTFLEAIAALDNALLPQRVRYRRLGLYAESLFHYFCDHICPLQLVGKNLQIKHHGSAHTKGEIDLLVGAIDDLLHIEMAVKFYLFDSHKMAFIGPNAQDQLTHKICRLTTHQLPLSRTPEAVDYFNERGWSVTQSALILKGVVFHHWLEQPSDLMGVDILGYAINETAEWGIWLRVYEWPEFLESLAAESTIIHIDKMAWMGLQINDQVDGMNMECKLGMWLVKSRRANHTFNATFPKTMRAIVVHDQWPEFSNH